MFRFKDKARPTAKRKGSKEVKCANHQSVNHRSEWSLQKTSQQGTERDFWRSWCNYFNFILQRDLCHYANCRLENPQTFFLFNSNYLSTFRSHETSLSGSAAEQLHMMKSGNKTNNEGTVLIEIKAKIKTTCLLNICTKFQHHSRERKRQLESRISTTVIEYLPVSLWFKGFGCIRGTQTNWNYVLVVSSMSHNNCSRVARDWMLVTALKQTAFGDLRWIPGVRHKRMRCTKKNISPAL